MPIRPTVLPALHKFNGRLAVLPCCELGMVVWRSLGVSTHSKRLPNSYGVLYAVTYEP